MEPRSRLYLAGGASALLFLCVQVGALALVDPFLTAGYRTVEDPADPANSLLYLVAVLVMTGVLLAVIRLGAGRLLRAAVALMAGSLSWYTFSVLAPAVRVSGVDVLAVGLSGLVAVALYVHPEWYVIDAAGVAMGAAGAALFGISFGPLPALSLLVALAAYDAVSVYRTEHMLDLAAGVTDLKLPLVLVVPLSPSYSFLEDDPMADDGGEGLDREAFFIGLGDAILPTVLVASAAVFLDPAPLVSGIALTVPALGAMAGTFCGFAVLLALVAKGRPHAGLPLLNGGAIAGYLVAAAASGVSLATATGLGPYV